MSFFGGSGSAAIVADLFSSPVPPDGYVVTVAGHLSATDGLGGNYRFNSASTATSDGFYVQNLNLLGSGAGRYERMPAFSETGTIKMWGSDTAPSGWAICDNSAISRSTYSILFSIVGTVFGSGDGSTTFNLPDFRQRSPLGKAASGTGSTLGATGGSIDHTHTVDAPNTTSSQPSATVTGLSLLGVAGAASDTHTHDVNIPQFDSGSANHPFQVVNFIIKL